MYASQSAPLDTAHSLLTRLLKYLTCFHLSVFVICTLDLYYLLKLVVDAGQTGDEPNQLTTMSLVVTVQADAERQDKLRVKNCCKRQRRWAADKLHCQTDAKQGRRLSCRRRSGLSTALTQTPRRIRST